MCACGLEDANGLERGEPRASLDHCRQHDPERHLGANLLHRRQGGTGIVAHVGRLPRLQLGDMRLRIADLAAECRADGNDHRADCPPPARRSRAAAVAAQRSCSAPSPPSAAARPLARSPAPSRSRRSSRCSVGVGVLAVTDAGSCTVWKPACASLNEVSRASSAIVVPFSTSVVIWAGADRRALRRLRLDTERSGVGARGDGDVGMQEAVDGRLDVALRSAHLRVREAAAAADSGCSRGTGDPASTCNRGPCTTRSR